MTSTILNGPVAPDSTDGTVDVRDFAAILRARRSVIFATVALALALAAIYLLLAPRIYTGVTSILIDTRSRSALGDTAVLAGSSPDAVLVESQVRLISSRGVIRRVVEAEHLNEDPEFLPRIGLRTRLMASLGLAGTPPGQEDRIAAATVSLAPHVVVKRSERTYIADIEVTSTDPLKAARLADAVAQAYLADQQSTRIDAASRDSEWVRGQISDMQAQLQAAEVKAQAYKRDNGLIDTNGKLLNEQELADASAGLTQARARQTEVKARLDQIKHVGASGRSLDSLPDALRSPAIDKLRSQYADISRQQATLRQTLGARHPALLESDQQLRDIRKLISEELARIEAGVSNEYQTAEANARALESRVDELKTQTSTSNGVRVHLDELQRDVDARRSVYDRFLRARDTVREQAVDAPIGRVIAAAAVPTAPSSPKTFAVLAVALAIGLSIGTALALLTKLRPRWPGAAVALAPNLSRAEEEEPAKLHEPATVPVLGFVPSPFGNAAHLTTRPAFLDRLQTAWPTAADAEFVPSLPAFRSSVQALGLPETTGPVVARPSPATLVMTSLSGCESRTTLALGTAEAAAASGRRTLVIDADEKCGLLRELVAPGARAALIDLMGTTRLCYRISSASRGSISVVPIVPNETQIARRLAGHSDTPRIDGIASNYDLVIFDGPSVGQAAQLDALAASVDMVLLIAPKDATRTDIDDAVDALSLPSSCTVAAVLTADVARGVVATRAA